MNGRCARVVDRIDCGACRGPDMAGPNARLEASRHGC